MKPLVSVLVPVYNVEPYLDRCMCSILEQTYSRLEIILVDDGSPDRCGAMCDDYACKDSRINVIHQKHMGLFAARNAGLDAAHGEYLFFADSDDWLEPTLVEESLALMKHHDADMVVFNHYDEWLDRTCESRQCNKAYDTQTIKEKILTSDILPVFWKQMYKRFLFEGVRLPSGENSMDAYVMGQVLYKASKIICNEHCLYHYFKGNRASITRHDSVKRIYNEYRARKQMALWAEKITDNEEIILRNRRKAFRYAVQIYNVNMIKNELTREQIQNIENYLQKKEMDSLAGMSRRNRLLRWCILHHVRIGSIIDGYCTLMKWKRRERERRKGRI